MSADKEWSEPLDFAGWRETDYAVKLQAELIDLQITFREENIRALKSPCKEICASAACWNSLIEKLHSEHKNYILDHPHTTGFLSPAFERLYKEGK